MPMYHVPGLAAAIKTCMVEWNPCNVVHPTVAAAICRHPAPSLSLWERWPSAARTERVNVYNANNVIIQNNAPRPSQSRLRRASSPSGRAKIAFFR